MKHKYSNKYKNVSIRPLFESDIEFLRKWRNDEANTKYLRKLPYITADMQRLWYEKYLSNEEELCFAIDEIETLNRMVGSLSLYDFTDKQAEFGKILIGDPDAHGKNIGVNSIVALLYVAFNDLKLERVILHVYVANTGAVHVYKKVGFSVENVHIADGKEEFLMKISKKTFLTRWEEK